MRHASSRIMVFVGVRDVIYTRLSLSQLRLSRITPNLDMKIWSLFEHGNLTTGNKLLWKRDEIAPNEQFLLISTIFSICPLLQEFNYIFIWNVVVRFIFSSILQIWYVEERISRNISYPTQLDPRNCPSWIILETAPLIQEGQLSVSDERMCTILVNRLED